MKKKIWIAAAWVLALAMLPIGVTVAKYYEQKNDPNGSATAIPFYFMIDKLGNAKTEETWELYGGDEKTIEFTVANYFDSARKNASDTTYTVKLEVTGTAPNVSLVGNSKTLANGQTDSVTLASGGDVAYTLTVPVGYKEGAVVTVTVKSSQPYEKTLTLTFNLHHYLHEVSYRVEDAPNTPFLELIVTVNHPHDAAKTNDKTALKAQALKLVWENVNTEENTLQVDLTANYLLNDNLQTTTGIKHSTEEYLIAVSTEQPIGMGETVVFRFFKADATKDYTTILQSVEGGAEYDEVNNVYTITLSQPPTNP